MSVQDFDELDIIGKTLSYEKYFDEMEIPDEDVEGFKTVGDVVNYVKAHNEE